MQAGEVVDYVPLSLRDKADVCPTCKGAGALSRNLPVDHPDYGRAVRCPDCQGAGNPEEARNRAIRRQREIDKLFSDVGIKVSERHQHFTWTHFEKDHLGELIEGKQIAISLARRWATGERIDYRGYGDPFLFTMPTTFEFSPSNSLVVQGITGTGKTSLAYVAFRDRLERGEVCLLVEFYALIDAIQSQYGKPDSKASDLVKTAAMVPVLVLDDLGNGGLYKPEKDDRQDKLWQILNMRYLAKRSTLITTNLDRKHMCDQFGQKIARRLDEMAVWTTMGGEDLCQFNHGNYGEA
jgi:DNA replication protein DnaC